MGSVGGPEQPAGGRRSPPAHPPTKPCAACSAADRPQRAQHSAAQRAPAAAPGGKTGCCAAARLPAAAPAPAVPRCPAGCAEGVWGRGAAAALGGGAAGRAAWRAGERRAPPGSCRRAWGHAPQGCKPPCRGHLCMMAAGQVSASSRPVPSSRWCMLASSKRCLRTEMPPP